MSSAFSAAVSQQPLSAPPQETATYLFTALMAVCLLGMGTWCVMVARRERTWLPIACLVGGALSFGFEPVLDAVAHIFYPLGTPLTAVTIFETTIPWYVVMAYTFWVGAGSYLISRWLDRGQSGRDVMKWFLIACLLEPMFEYPAVLSKVLIYYGDQPFKLLDFPLYWAFPNTAAAFVAGYVLHLAKPHLSGARGFAIASLIPALAYCATSAMTSWPVWLAINAETPMAVVWLAGAVTIALTVTLISLVGWCLDRGLGVQQVRGRYS